MKNTMNIEEIVMIATITGILPFMALVIGCGIIGALFG